MNCIQLKIRWKNRTIQCELIRSHHFSLKHIFLFLGHVSDIQQVLRCFNQDTRDLIQKFPYQPHCYSFVRIVSVRGGRNSTPSQSLIVGCLSIHLHLIQVQAAELAAQVERPRPSSSQPLLLALLLECQGIPKPSE